MMRTHYCGDLNKTHIGGQPRRPICLQLFGVSIVAGSLGVGAAFPDHAAGQARGETHSGGDAGGHHL